MKGFFIIFHFGGSFDKRLRMFGIVNIKVPGTKRRSIPLDRCIYIDRTCKGGILLNYPYSNLYTHPVQMTPYYASNTFRQALQDQGKQPFVLNIQQATLLNPNFRTAIWSGIHLQSTIMNIPVGSDIGLELHPDTDQFLYIVNGQGFVQMGDQKEHLNFTEYVHPMSAIFVPAGKWHNITNTGPVPLQLFTIYAPPEHPHGTVHHTQQEAIEDEHHS